MISEPSVLQWKWRWTVFIEKIQNVSPRADLKASTLSCMKKRRKSPNLPQNEGAPLLFRGALSKWGRAPIIWGRAPIIWGRALIIQGCSPQPTCTFPPLQTSTYLPATSADSPPPIPRSGGDHIPLHPFWHEILHCGLVASGRPSNNITSGHYES